MNPPDSLRFPLVRLPIGAPGAKWRGRFPREDVHVVVAGDVAAPYPEHAATLWDLVDRFDQVKKAIEAFVAEMLPDGHVPLQSGNGGFRAGDCGFERGGFAYLRLSVTEIASPTTASITFSTGLPDGYATFEVRLVSGCPVEISAFAS